MFALLLVALTVRAGIPTCSRAEAVAAAEAKAESAGLTPSRLEVQIGGPYDWNGFRADHPRFARMLGTPVVLFLEQRRFYFVHLSRKPDPARVVFGGGHWSFIAASTCEVLYSGLEK